MTSSSPSLSSASLRRKLFYLPLCSILLVWSLLYLPNLRTSPTWYGDEALALSSSLDLTHGIAAHRATWNSFWHPAGPYQPFYEILVGTGARLAGSDILGGRVVNTIFALSIALVLYFYGRPILGILPAWFAALLFLSYEQTIIHFRWIFTHNLVALGFCIMVLALARPARFRNDLTAGVGLALAAGALPIFVYGLVPAGLIRILRPRSWVWLFGPAALMILLSLALGYLMSPYNFLPGDLSDMVRFYVGSSRESSGGLAGVALNFYNFFRQDTLHAVGLVMLLLALCRRYYAIGVSGLIVAILLVQNRQNLAVFYYQAIIFFPLMICAYAVGIRRLSGYLRKQGIHSRAAHLVQGLGIPVALFLAALMIPQVLSGTLKPRTAFWTTQSIPDAEGAAAWVNAHTTPDDLVITSVNIAWLLKARTADLLMAATWEGWPTWPYDRPLPREHFRYPADVSKAKYLVIADIDQRWTFSQPNISRFLDRFEKENWPIVWRSKNYAVAANPAFPLPKD